MICITFIDICLQQSNRNCWNREINNVEENNMDKMEQCYVYTHVAYDKKKIKELLFDFIKVKPGQKVVIKPNWVREGHIDKPDEWEHIITHPVIVEAVAEIVVEKCMEMAN